MKMLNPVKVEVEVGENEEVDEKEEIGEKFQLC